ncbi:uncharacterized protein [Watersipora subatra]|uniref:uncharacterized protein n=1 Tax=Watersipora subatra TaxID=2589382 RepID=UPI00355C53B8
MASASLDVLASIISDHHYSHLPVDWIKSSIDVLSNSSNDIRPSDVQCGTQHINDKLTESSNVLQECYVELDINNNCNIHTKENVRASKTTSILKSPNSRLKAVLRSKRVTFEDAQEVHPTQKYEEKKLETPHTQSSNNHTVDTAKGLPKQDVTHSSLDQLLRESYAYAIDHSWDENEIKIHETEACIKVLHNSQSNKHILQSPPEYNDVKLNSDDITRIKELFPPDNYQPPKNEARDMQCIRGCPVDGPVPLKTLRCVSNHTVLKDAGGTFQSNGDCFSANTVNYLPEPSIWTPRHALMNTAPCISSPGIFQNTYQSQSCVEDSDVTNTDEETAIY